MKERLTEIVTDVLHFPHELRSLGSVSPRIHVQLTIRYPDHDGAPTLRELRAWADRLRLPAELAERLHHNARLAVQHFTLLIAEYIEDAQARVGEPLVTSLACWMNADGPRFHYDFTKEPA